MRSVCWLCGAKPSSALDELKSLERGRLQLAANEYTCMYLLPAIDQFRRQFPEIGVSVHRMLASRIAEELSLRTFEIGVTSFRLDPEQFRTIAVYNDSLAFIVSPKHRLARQRVFPSTIWARKTLLRTM